MQPNSGGGGERRGCPPLPLPSPSPCVRARLKPSSKKAGCNRSSRIRLHPFPSCPPLGSPASRRHTALGREPYGSSKTRSVDMARGVTATDRTDEIRERTCAVIAGLVISTPIEGGGPWEELRGERAAVPCTRCHVAMTRFITSGNPASRKAENGISYWPRACRGCQANLTGSLCGRQTKHWRPSRCGHGCGSGTRLHLP